MYFPSAPSGPAACIDGPPETGRFGNAPHGIAIDTTTSRPTTLYVADQQCGIRRVTSDGVSSMLPSDPTRPGGFNSVGIAFGRSSGVPVLYAVYNSHAVVAVDTIDTAATPGISLPSSEI